MKKYAESPRRLAAKKAVTERRELRKRRDKEIAELKALGAAARRFAKRDRVLQFAQRLRNHVVRRYDFVLDWDAAWLAEELRKGIARGEYSIKPRHPTTASIDQFIPGLGYHKANIQIIPLWFNFAKNAWAQDDVELAIARWMNSRHTSRLGD